MSTFQFISIVARLIAVSTCTALAILVFSQFRQDTKSRLFGVLMINITIVALLGTVSRLATTLQYSDTASLRIFEISSAFTSFVPVMIFIFATEYLESWTQWRRWIARIICITATLAAIQFFDGHAFANWNMTEDGYLTYKLTPFVTVLLVAGEFAVLFVLELVAEQYLRRRHQQNARVLLGFVLLCVGFILIAIEAFNRYAPQIIVWSVASVVIAGPVLQQRLFDPLAQLNIKLTHRAEQLSLINRVGQQISSVLMFPTLLEAVAQEIQRSFGYHCVTIYMPDPNGQLDIQAVAKEPREDDNNSEGYKDKNLYPFTVTADQDQLIYIPDIRKYDQNLPPSLSPQTRSFVNIPLFVVTPNAQKTFIGVLGIEHKRVNAFTPEDLEALQILSRQITSAIQNAQLFEAVQSANAAKTKFIGYIGHEVRNPIGNIFNTSESIVDHPYLFKAPLPAEYQEEIVRIYTQANHLRKLVDDLLDMSKIEAGKLEITLEKVDPLPILEQVEQSSSGRLRAGVQFQRGYAAPLPTISADKTRFIQILMNLIGNAIKFTEHGSITLSTCVEPEMLCFSVTDTGPGMSEDTLRGLFQPFNQGISSISQRYGGTGLGLSISKQLVELHGGRIWADSTLGHGTTFYFTLPLAK